MNSHQKVLVLVALLVGLGGCDEINKLLGSFKETHDPLVGTWRAVGAANGESITFSADGTYRMETRSFAPALGKEVIAAYKAMESVPGRYSRGTDVIVLSMDIKAIREATSSLKKYGPDTLKGDTLDDTWNYKLGGDVLEVSHDGKTWRHVRSP
jgi:hypothetical protein